MQGYKQRNLRFEIMFLLRRLMPPKRLRPEDFPFVSADRESEKHLTDTTNNVVSLTVGGEPCFFRECRKHTSKRDYILETVDRFFGAVCTDEHREECRALVREKLKNRKNRRRFFFMGMENDPTSALACFQKTGDAAAIGIPRPYPDEMQPILNDLARYVWGEFVAYRLNGGLPRGAYQTYHASHGVAAHRVAQSVDPALIPETRFCRLKTSDGQIRFGTLMAKADGVDPVGKSIAPSPSFARDLLKLHALNVICHERDHRPGNYFVAVENGTAVRPIAFDNDAPMTFFPTPRVDFSSYMDCSPLIRNGRILRPHFEREAAEVMMNLSAKALREAVRDCLSRAEIAAACRRLQKLTEALRRTAKEDPDFLLSADEWTESAMRDELSPSYGKTYLQLYLNYGK